MSRRMNHAQLAAIVNEWVREIGSNAKFAAREAGATPKAISEIKDDEEALKYLVDSLLRGTTIPQFMIDEGLDWPAFAAWLAVDKRRQEAFEQAKKDRGLMARENLLHGWWQTAGMVPDSPVTHGDVSKARDAIAKAEGIFKQVVEHAGKEDGAPIRFESIERVVVDPK